METSRVTSSSVYLIHTATLSLDRDVVVFVSIPSFIDPVCTYENQDENMHPSAILVDYTHAYDVSTMQTDLLHFLTISSFDFHPSSTYFNHFATTTKD